MTRTKDALDEIQMLLGEISANVENNTRILNRMDRVINGNGRSGLVAKVARHGQAIRIIAWVGGVILTGACAAVAGWLL